MQLKEGEHGREESSIDGGMAALRGLGHTTFWFAHVALWQQFATLQALAAASGGEREHACFSVEQWRA